MWVVPDTERIEPGYEQLDIGSELAAGELVVVASGMPKHADDKAISIRQRHAALHAARLDAEPQRRATGCAAGARLPRARARPSWKTAACSTPATPPGSPEATDSG